MENRNITDQKIKKAGKSLEIVISSAFLEQLGIIRVILN